MAEPKPTDLPGVDEALRTLAELGAGLFDVAGAAPGPPPTHLAAARYQALVEQIPAVTFMASLDGGLHEIYVSPQVEALLGFTQEEWTRDPVLWFQQLHPDDRALWNREFARGCATGGPFRAECRFLARDGHVVWVRGEARLIRDERGRPVALQGVAFDITDSKRAEEVVRASLREKELLLREIHHRVKNNLQVTSSLLRLQAGQTADPHARALLRESQDRIHSMALVHEMLYRSADLARVDFAAYARRLVEHLMRAQQLDRRRIAHAVEIAAITLEIDVAVPCGLIINELVSNALKHAFPGDRAGRIWIRMTADPTHHELRVGDDGVGIPDHVDLADTLGLQLVRTLTRQIDGALAIERRDGTEFAIRFPRGQGRP